MIPADIIQKPKWSYEKADRRTLDSKTFRIGRNKYRLIKVFGAIHYKEDLKDDNEHWRTIDLTPKSKGWFSTSRYEINKAPFNLTVMKNEIGFTYISKQGGIVKVKLSKIGMVDVDGNINISPRVEDNKIIWDNVVGDLDIYLELRSASIQFFKILKTNNAPRVFEWEVEEDEQHDLKVNSKHIGWDADKDKVKLIKEIKNERIEDSKKKYVLREIIEEKTAEIQDKKNRIKEWTTKIKYPLLIDVPDITEDIIATKDDGHSYIFFGSSGWYYTSTKVIINYNGSTDYKHGGLRFQGINIPQEATIDLANLKVKLKTQGSNPIIKIYGDDVNNAVSFGTGAAAPRNITKTTAFATWDPAGGGFEAIDVTTIIQEIVDRTAGGGWASGNNIRFGLFDTPVSGYAAISAYDKSQADGAHLEIDFTAGGAVTRRRVITSNGFMKLKTIIITTGVIIALIASFLGGQYIKQKPECNQYVWNGSEEVCIPDNLLDYINKLEEGAINRLKSKRGIFPK